MSTSLAATTRSFHAYPAADEWRLMWDMGKTLVNSKFLPRTIDTTEKAVAVMLKGRELGWPPMRAFQYIHIIEGKPTLAAEGMLALIYDLVPGAIIRIVETTNERCVIDAARPGQPPTRFIFSIEDAQRAQVMGKDNWRKYPRAMLRARCISEMARAVFPDALMGCSYVPEELGALVDEQGDVIEVRTETPRSEAPPPSAASEPARPAQEKSTQAPMSSPSTNAKPREASIYTGASDQAQRIEKILAQKKVPRDRWAEVDDLLRGKPSTDLWDIIRVVTTTQPEQGAMS